MGSYYIIVEPAMFGSKIKLQSTDTIIPYTHWAVEDAINKKTYTAPIHEYIYGIFTSNSYVDLYLYSKDSETIIRNVYVCMIDKKEGDAS